MQFFELPAEVFRREIHALHRVLRLPPNTMRLTDILSLSTWSPSPAPRGLGPHNFAPLWRAATFTITNWRLLHQALHDSAMEHLP
eukprot:6084190-Pyramimonas_sp.AAC.1